MALYDSLRDVANRVIGQDSRHADSLDPAMAFRFGIVEDDNSVEREDPDHNDFLYASLSRPLGMWFKPEGVEYSFLGGSRRTGVIGTSEPLGVDVLNSYELTPYDPTTRAATLLRIWDREERPVLASAEGDRGVMDRVDLLMQVPEHDGDWSRIIYDEKGPFGHFEYNKTDPIWDIGAGTLGRAIKDLLDNEKELIPETIAEDQVNRWLEDGMDPVEA